MFTSYAKKRATLATVVFAVFGLASLFFVNDWYSALPLIAFYAILILNTYFSISCFASITPRDNKLQPVLDVGLAFLIIAQAASLNSPALFVLFAMLLFLFATSKYILLYPDSRYQKLLRRKIQVDILGAAACALALGGISAGFAFITTWLLVASFLVANIYLFFIRPLYVLTPNDNIEYTND